MWVTSATVKETLGSSPVAAPKQLSTFVYFSHFQNPIAMTKKGKNEKNSGQQQSGFVNGPEIWWLSGTCKVDETPLMSKSNMYSFIFI